MLLFNHCKKKLIKLLIELFFKKNYFITILKLLHFIAINFNSMGNCCLNNKYDEPFNKDINNKSILDSSIEDIHK
jgi:hypothetical protein